MTASSAPPLLLVAASGLAREVLAVVRRTGSHQVVGLLDDDPARHGTEVGGVRVLGPVESVADHPDAALLLCVGRGEVRELLAAGLELLGAGKDRYATVVHPSVEVPASCSVDAGAVVLAGTVLTADVRLGRHVVVMPHVTLTHDDVVDDFATLCAGVVLSGGVRVRRSAYLGAGAAVREQVVIGEGATLGMGAVLVSDLPDGETWVGCPARILRPSGGTGSAPSKGATTRGDLP